MADFPLYLRKGDTLDWDYSNPDYPSDDYTLTLTLVGPTTATYTATEDGTGYNFTVNIGVCDGEYTYYLIATAKTGSPIVRTTIYGDFVKVKPDPTELTAGSDQRSHVRKTYEAICARIEGRASNDHEQYSYNGRSITKLSWDELIRAKNYYGRLLAAENRGGSQKRTLEFFSG